MSARHKENRRQPTDESELLDAIELEQRLAPDRVGSALTRARHSGDEAIRQTVLEHLPPSAMSETVWRDYVREALESRSPGVRQAAAEAIGRLRWADRVPDLMGLLQDRNHLVRVEAVEALRALRATRSCADLQVAMTNDRHWLVRGYAAAALADLCPDQSLPTIENRLTEERNPWVKANLLIALCAAGRQQWLPELLRRLESRDHRVRCVVANNLATLANESNQAAIRAALTAALQRETTEAAGEALRRALNVLERNSSTRER